MSAETDLLRQKLLNARASAVNQALVEATVTAIDNGLALLDHRDGLEAAGVTLPALDTTIVGAVYDPIKAAVDALNANQVAIDDKATILTELAAL